MKIALFGYGKMGRLVEKAAQAQGHQISVIFSRRSEASHHIAEADLAIDFSVGSLRPRQSLAMLIARKAHGHRHHGVGKSA